MFLRRTALSAFKGQARQQSTVAAAGTQSSFVGDFLKDTLPWKVKAEACGELDIDTTTDISTSKPAYSQHILVHTGKSSWPSKVELDPTSRVGELKQLFRKQVDEASVKAGKVIPQVAIHNTDHPSPDRCTAFSVLPAGYTLTFPNCTSTSQIFNLLSQADQKLPSNAPVGVVRQMLESPVILVCGHEERDHRCGVLGPQIAEALRKASPKANVAQVSHLGGHKYAGNVVTYSNVNGKWVGNWYGRVKPEDAPALVEAMNKGEVWNKDYNWRGAVEW